MNERTVSDLLGLPRQSGGNLRIENRGRNTTDLMQDDLDILTPRMEKLHGGFIQKNGLQNGDINLERIDDRNFAIGVQLQKAQRRVVRFLAKKLGIDRQNASTRNGVDIRVKSLLAVYIH